MNCLIAPPRNILTYLLTMEEAVAKVRGGAMSIKMACAVHGSPRASLHNRVKGRHQLKVGHQQPVFSEAEERSLVHHIQVASEWGYPFSMLNMCFVAKKCIGCS